MKTKVQDKQSTGLFGGRVVVVVESNEDERIVTEHGVVVIPSGGNVTGPSYTPKPKPKPQAVVVVDPEIKPAQRATKQVIDQRGNAVCANDSHRWSNWKWLCGEERDYRMCHNCHAVEWR